MDYCTDVNDISLDRVDSDLGYTIDNVNFETFLVKTNLIAENNNVECDFNEKLSSKFINSGEKIDKGTLSSNIEKEFFGKQCYLCTKSSNGVDRFNPNLNYSFRDNLRPCCTDCNYIKKDFWPFKEFITHMKKINESLKLDIDEIITLVSNQEIITKRPIKKRKTEKISFNLSNVVVYVYKNDKLVAKFDSKKSFCNALNINFNGKNIVNQQIDKLVLPRPYRYIVYSFKEYYELKEAFKIFNQLFIIQEDYNTFLIECTKERKSLHYRKIILLDLNSKKVAYVGCTRNLRKILSTQNVEKKVQKSFSLEFFDWNNEFHSEEVDIESQKMLYDLK